MKTLVLLFSFAMIANAQWPCPDRRVCQSPNMIGMTLDEAVTKWSTHGFTGISLCYPLENCDNGRVINQNVIPGKLYGCCETILVLTMQ